MLVESIHQRSSEVVINNPESPSNRRLATDGKYGLHQTAARISRPCERHSWSEVFVVPRPERCFPIGFSTGAIRDYFVRSLPKRHRISAVRDELIQTGIWRHLISMCFVNWLQQGISQSQNQCQGWPNVPGVLHVKV